MLDKFTYTNHLGEVITFGDFPYFANQSDLRDYEWKYDADFTRFERGTVTKTLKVYVVGTEENAIKAKDALYEIVEKDVLAMKKGTFKFTYKVGNETITYEMKAFIYGSKKTNYLTSKHVLAVDLAVVTDTPQWRTEKPFKFTANTELEVIEYGRNYTEKRGFPYGYSHSQLNTRVINDSLYECGFKMIIWGAVTNPTIKIGDNLYRVDVTVGKDDVLEIISDGTTKTITCHRNGNVKEDCFAKRYKKQSVFAKIKTGVNQVEWDNTFAFDLTLLIERSEPKWTL